VAGRLTAVRSRGRGVSAARLACAPVVVRGRRGGERIRLQPNRPTRTLKNLLQEAGVPPWQRAALPLLFCGEQLVWAAGVGVAAQFQAEPGEPAWQFRWQAPKASRVDR
jgi:tRNA(Ile)-lysidine synthase